MLARDMCRVTVKGVFKGGVQGVQTPPKFSDFFLKSEGKEIERKRKKGMLGGGGLPLNIFLGLIFFRVGLRNYRGVEKFSGGVEKFSWGVEKFSGGVEKFSGGGEKFSWGVEKFSGRGLRNFRGELRNFRGGVEKLSGGGAKFSGVLRNFRG